MPTRRDVLKVGGLGALAAAGIVVPLGQTVQGKSASRLPDRAMPRPFKQPFRGPEVLQPYRPATYDTSGQRTEYYRVDQTAGTASIIPGYTTPIWGYNGTFPGPTIKVDRGTKVQLRVANKLPAVHPQFEHNFQTSTHLHGSASLPQYDGFANDLTYPEYVKFYEYPNSQPARTMWYHDHAAHNTAINVYTGLAAHYHLQDDVEKALLPQGEFDVPLTVSDAMFAADGRLAYDDNSTSGMWGDVVLVNGTPWPVMPVQRRVYRFRFLNASISRSYRPQLSTGDSVTMVATDGGLMPKAQQVRNWRHAPAERYEFLVDFRKYAPGQVIELRNLSNQNNVDYDHTNKIMAFRVTGDAVDTSDPTWNRIPTTLAPNDPVMALQPSQSTRTERMRIKKNDEDRWAIDDTTWEDVVDSEFTKSLADPDLGEVQIWEFENSSGGWFHPMHVHLVDFKILSRNGRPPFPYEQGPKDVVYLGEGETVRVLAKFGPYRGKYMIHCHNLPHEDHDMMAMYTVGLKDGWDDNDPMTSAPCEPDYGQDRY